MYCFPTLLASTYGQQSAAQRQQILDSDTFKMPNVVKKLNMRFKKD